MATTTPNPTPAKPAAAPKREAPRAASARTRTTDKHPLRRATDTQTAMRSATPIEASNPAGPIESDLTRAAPRAPGEWRRVRATRMGYYGEKLRRPGDVFTISMAKNPDKVIPQSVDLVTGKIVAARTVKGSYIEYSERWMEVVDGSIPESTTGSAEALRQEHDNILTGRLTPDGKIAAAPPASTGAQDPLGALD